MNFYERHILPKIIDFTCSGNITETQRKKIVPFAKGKVLEIGFGTGLNLPFYNPNTVEKIIGIEPSNDIVALAQKRIAEAPILFEHIPTSAEEIPLDNNSIDTVLVTYTLCSIPNLQLALKEMKRVLSPSGKLYFCEHGLAPDLHIQKWQHRLNPIWNKIGGGCNLNRDISNSIYKAGLQIQNIEKMYTKGWKPASFNYLGTAVL